MQSRIILRQHCLRFLIDRLDYMAPADRMQEYMNLPKPLMWTSLPNGSQRRLGEPLSMPIFHLVSESWPAVVFPGSFTPGSPPRARCTGTGSGTQKRFIPSRSGGLGMFLNGSM